MNSLYWWRVFLDTGHSLYGTWLGMWLRDLGWLVLWNIIKILLYIFFPNTYNRHSTAGPWGSAMWYLFSSLIYVIFILFIHYKMVQIFEILFHGNERSTYCTLSISWLLITWWHKDPGHHRPLYWPSLLRRICFSNANDNCWNWSILG